MTWILSGFADEAATDLDAQIKVLVDGGMSSIDLRNLDGFNIADFPIEQAELAKQKLDAAGIKVGMFGSPLGKIDIADDMAIDLDKLRHLAKLADIFQTRKVRIFSYFNEKGGSAELYQTESLSRMAQLKSLAIDLGLSLYHENERDIYGDLCDHVKRIADELRDPGPAGSDGAFRMIFDFDNYNQCEEDVWQNWGQLKDVTDAFHLKDSDKQCQHVPIGTGAGYANEILSDALSRGWSGHLGLEPHLAHSPAVMATGPGGSANQALGDMDDVQCFAFAIDEAKKLLNHIGAAFE
jgi:sugar phosphate isomerase/epimerase